MKILVCDDKHCRNNHSEQLLAKLKTTGVEFAPSACMDMCDSGPNVFTFPDLKMYGSVTMEKLEDIISGNNMVQPYNEEIYDLEMNKEYRENPMHKRTVKLFRWHLGKQDDFSVLELNNSINAFESKYDISGMEFMFPVKIALINTVKGPDLPKLINYLGKEKTMTLLEKHLRGK